MREIEQYFDAVDSLLAHSGAQESEVTYTWLSQVKGIVEGLLYLANGSRLEFEEQVYIAGYRPTKQLYRYQYLREGESVFRYDNAAHHADLAGYPHHKHIAREKLPATEPTLSQVLDEVAALMREAEAGPPPSPKQRK